MNIRCFLLEPVKDDKNGRLWRRTDTGEIGELDSFPVGAMWLATWYARDEDDPNTLYHCSDFENQTTPPLIVKTPGGHWVVDSRASNCALPQDKVHRCWIRHGEPPNITVDKSGLTCQAGAGSIICGSYHGFLRNGELTDC